MKRVNRCKDASLLLKILRQEGTKALREVCQEEIICPHPLRAGKEFQHEVTSVRNSGAGAKRFFGLRNDMKRHSVFDTESHSWCNSAMTGSLPSTSGRGENNVNDLAGASRGWRRLRRQMPQRRLTRATKTASYRLNVLTTSRKVAFTLAEVLITLAIIGIVAALTIPTLVSKYQKRSLEVKVTKFYSQMLNAVKLHMADEGVDKVTQTSLLYNPNLYGDVYNEKAYTFLHKYFKVTSDCEIIDMRATDCFAETYTSADGSETADSRLYEVGACVTTIDGASVCLGPGHSYPATVQFDINGKKGPNKAGYDYFSFAIYHDGSINDGLSPECRKDDEKCFDPSAEDTLESRLEICERGIGATYGAGCFTKFLDNGFKMDY